MMIIPLPAPDGQTAYLNGRIYTVNEDQPWAEAMIVEDGVIKMIGTNKAIQEALEATGVSIDLNNRMVMPGIHDVHQHPLEAGSDNFQFVLNENVSSPESYRPGIESAVRQNPNAKWVLGAGFDITLFLERETRPIDILDEISTTQAIAIMELSSHSIWVNSKALELAGIDRNSPNPQGGIIMKDSNSEPNGLLIDNAGNLIVDLAIQSIPNSEENDYFGLTDYSLPLLAQNGITSICDARAY